jgi:hypothetical protein
MMTTNMTKISLFVLAGMISGSSATKCTPPCHWENRPGLKYPLCFCPSASSFVSLEASVGVDEGHYLGAEDYIVDENIDSSWKSGSGSGSGSGDAAFSDEYGYYDYEDEDMDEDEDEDGGAECDFGSDYTIYHISSDFCSFDVGIGIITNFEESNTISSGDTNVTTITHHGDYAIWKVGDKDSTLQCYSDVSNEAVLTSYPNGYTFVNMTGDTVIAGDSNDTVADGIPLSTPGLYYFKGGRYEYCINSDAHGHTTKAEGDITDLCEVLGGGAAPAPTPPSLANNKKRSYLRVN